MARTVTATLTRSWAMGVVHHWDGRDLPGLRRAFARAAVVELARQGDRMVADLAHHSEPVGSYTHTREPDGSWTIRQEIS